MQHKCKSYSAGSGAGAVAYLLGLKDAKGRVRAGVEVLCGNPGLNAQLIDSLKVKYKYVSTVIAFAHEDDPTPEEVAEVLADWERVAFAGLRKSQYTYCAILHLEDDGKKHIHILTPRVCLESGRSLNIAPPSHQYYFAKWRNVWNYSKGWARPEDPTRARLLQPGAKAYESAEELRSGISECDPKLKITNWLADRVQTGAIENRLDLLESIGELGEITFVDRDYIYVRLESRAKPIRLKGLLYGKSFSAELVRETGAAAKARPRGRAKLDLGKAAAAREVLAAACESRARYNRKRYLKPVRRARSHAEVVSVEAPVPEREDQRGDEATQHRPIYSQAADHAPDWVADVVAGNHDDCDVRLDADHRGLIGLVAGSISRERGELAADEAAAVEPRILRQRCRTEVLPTSVITGGVDDEHRNAIDRCIAAAQRAAYAAGDLIDRFISGASADFERAAQRTSEFVERTVIALRNAAAAARLDTAATQQAVAGLDRAAGRAIPRLKEKMDEELVRFKYDISLVDYAVATFGYVMREDGPSRGGKVLERGDHRILVARAETGHELYYNVCDESDSGSLIDLIQRQAANRPNLSLIRKQLRPWLSRSKKPTPMRSGSAASIRPIPTPKDRHLLLVAWARTKPYIGAYLMDERGLTMDTIAAFGVTEDAQGDAYFAHRDKDGEICGFEIVRSTDQPMLPQPAKGGTLGLWMMKDQDVVHQIVVTDSALDAASFAQLHHVVGTLYVSTGDAITAEKSNMLIDLLDKHRTAELVLAHGNDAGGHRMATQLKALARADMEVRRELPDAKGWNAQLLDEVRAEQEHRPRSGRLPRM